MMKLLKKIVEYKIDKKIKKLEQLKVKKEFENVMETAGKYKDKALENKMYMVFALIGAAVVLAGIIFAVKMVVARIKSDREKIVMLEDMFDDLDDLPEDLEAQYDSNGEI